MSQKNAEFEMIEDAESLARFYELNKSVPWMAFDTEFVGEKRFRTLICLIQVSTQHGSYLIDPLKLDHIDPILEMLANPDILTITHAGENDFRLIYLEFDILPQNLFDTQVAAGFLGYKYPVSFARLLESELRVTLSKGYAVTDWETRPIKARQLRYALNDVIYLKELYDKMSDPLKNHGRMSWLEEELKTFEQASFYTRHPLKEILASNIFHNLKPKEQFFLLRLHRWRNWEAERLNYSREMILSSKHINPIVKTIHAGPEALRSNRRLPEKVIKKHGEHFLTLYKAEPEVEEINLLAQVPKPGGENPRQDLILEMLHLLIRYKCLDEQIAPSLVLPRGVLKRLKAAPTGLDESLESGWRRAFLGDQILRWLEHRTQLRIVFTNDRFEITLDE